MYRSCTVHTNYGLSSTKSYQLFNTSRIKIFLLKCDDVLERLHAIQTEYLGTVTHKNKKREKFITTEFDDSLLISLSLLSKATSCTRF